jgi:drug/metabolite transporter (DMT)-like permease
MPVTTKIVRHNATPALPHVPLAGIFHLLVLYVVWGSTYLAIRIAVGPAGGFPPFSLGATRVLIAGGLIVAVCALVGKRVRPTASELFVLVASGMLLWVGGNGLVVLAETRADSGYAALLVAAAPMWVAAVESVVDRRLPSPLLVGSLVVGFAGIAILSAPRLEAGADGFAIVCLLAAGLSWALGLVLQQRRPVRLEPIVSAGWQQLFAGGGFVMVAMLAGEPTPAPSSDAWWALGYLIVFGSLLAFTSFVFAIRLLPSSLVMTYAYVNPVIAVALGWAVLGEAVTGWTYAGAALVLVAVAGVFRERRRISRVA